jgi:DNA-binding transcriptional MerR regulator
MAWTVGEVAKMAKVSVRTLHHYDAVGLLGPSDRSDAGYRLYEMADLERLQQALFFKELGFSLEEIRGIMLDPSFDRAEALRAQRKLLAEKAKRTESMLATIDEALGAMEKGRVMDEKDMFEVFGDNDPRQFTDEVQQRWGDTEAYKESIRRFGKMSKDEIKAIMADTDALEAEFAAKLDAGAAPDDPAVQALVERHRLGIENWYPCSKEMHANLGRMYVEDARFRKHYDDRREGLARYVCDAIQAAAR